MLTKRLLPVALLLVACGGTPTSPPATNPPPGGGTPAPGPLSPEIFSGAWTWTLTPSSGASQGRIQWQAPQNEEDGFTVSGERFECANATQPSTCSPNGTARVVYSAATLQFEMEYESSGATTYYTAQDEDGEVGRDGGAYLLQGSGTLATGPSSESADFTLRGAP